MNNYLPKVGDLIIDCEQIHVITKVENDRLFYSPYSPTGEHRGCTDSIPLNNLDKACLRPIMTKSEAKSFLTQISKEEPIAIPEAANKNNLANTLKEIIYLNDPVKTARLLIFLNQNTTLEKSLSRFDQSIHDQALTHLSNEISAACGISFEAAKKQVFTATKH